MVLPKRRKAAPSATFKKPSHAATCATPAATALHKSKKAARTRSPQPVTPVTAAHPSTSRRTAEALLRECHRAGVAVPKRKVSLRQRLDALEAQKAAKTTAAKRLRQAATNEEETHPPTTTKTAAEGSTKQADGATELRKPAEASAPEVPCGASHCAGEACGTECGTPSETHPKNEPVTKPLPGDGFPPSTSPLQPVPPPPTLTTRVTACTSVSLLPHDAAAVAAVAYALENGCYGVFFPSDGSCLQVLRNLNTAAWTESVLYVNAKHHSFVFVTTTGDTFPSPTAHAASPPGDMDCVSRMQTHEESQQQQQHVPQSTQPRHYLLIPFALGEKFRALLSARKWWQQHRSAEASSIQTAVLEARWEPTAAPPEDGMDAVTRVKSLRIRTESFGVGLPVAGEAHQTEGLSSDAGGAYHWRIPYVADAGQDAESGTYCFALANKLEPFPNGVFYGD